MCWIWEGLEEAHLLNDKTCYLADYGYKSPSEGFEYKVNGSNRIKTKREEKREDCLLRTSICWHMLLLWDREWSFGHDPWSEPDPCSRSAERWPGRRRGGGGGGCKGGRGVWNRGVCALCWFGICCHGNPRCFFHVENAEHHRRLLHADFPIPLPTLPHPIQISYHNVPEMLQTLDIFTCVRGCVFVEGEKREWDIRCCSGATIPFAAYGFSPLRS